MMAYLIMIANRPLGVAPGACAGFLRMITRSMIDVREAARAAIQYCHDLFGEGADRFVLEEVQLSEDEKHWLITVGFNGLSTEPVDPLTLPLQGFMARPFERKYKVVDVDAETGNIRAVKMRQPLERIS